MESEIDHMAATGYGEQSDSGRGKSRWVLVGIPLLSIVFLWQWREFRLSESTRAKLHASERHVLLEERLKAALGGGARLDMEMSEGFVGSLQRQVLSVRPGAIRVPDPGDGPRPLFEEASAPLAEEAGRKLKVASSALSASEADWLEVGEVLEDAEKRIAAIESVEERIGKALTDPLWSRISGGAAAGWSDLSGDAALVRTLVDYRQALMLGDEEALSLARAYAEWLTDRVRLQTWSPLMQPTQELHEALASQLRRPEGATGEGPSAWLSLEAAEVASRLGAVDRSVDVARWRAAVDPEWLEGFRASVQAVDTKRWTDALDRCRQVLSLHRQVEAEHVAVEGERSRVAGNVPTVLWDRLDGQLTQARRMLWEMREGDAEKALADVSLRAQERVRWLAMADRVKEQRARWQSLPEAFRQGLGAKVDADLAAAIARTDIGQGGFANALARYEDDLADMEQLIVLGGRRKQVAAVLAEERRRADGSLPLGAWDRANKQLEAVDDAFARGDTSRIEAGLAALESTAQERASWLGLLERVSAQRARWQELSEGLRKGAAARIKADLDDAIRQTGLDMQGFLVSLAAHESALVGMDKLFPLSARYDAVAAGLATERSRADGLVPLAVWGRSAEALLKASLALQEGDPKRVEASLAVVEASATERSRWLALADRVSSQRIAWKKLPLLHRKKKHEEAEAAIAMAQAQEGIEPSRFEVALSKADEAIRSVEAEWLDVALATLPRALAAEEDLAVREWQELQAYFGDDPRLVTVRVAVASASLEVQREVRLRRAGLSAAEGTVVDSATGMPKRVVHEATGATMVLIPAGEFTMGSPAGEGLRKPDEAQHKRVIRRPFYLGITELTQAQWRRVMGNNPSKFKGDELPVEQVSWNECQEFLRRAGDGIRLPSEAEWEYACRAGTSGAFHFGSVIETKQVNYDGNYPYGPVPKGAYRERTVPAGSMPANNWGLHEMHGNLWEWCADSHDDYPSNGTEDPVNRGTDPKVVRGGSWFSGASSCRSGNRGKFSSNGIDDQTGLRIARSLPE